MNQASKREDRVEMQCALLEGDLFRSVADTAAALRSSHDYDNNRWSGSGELAVLCHVLQSSARRDGRVTMAGMSFELMALRQRAKAGR